MTGKKGRRGHGEGSIYQQPDGLWRGAVDLGWHGGQRRRRYVSGKTRAEVVRKVGRLVEAADQGRVAPTRVPTLAAWLDTYIREVIATSARPSTRARYEQEIRLYIGPELGRYRLDQIRPQHLARFYQQQLQSLAPGSVRRLHALLRRSLTIAVRWGLIQSNPALMVDPPQPQAAEVKPLSLAESRAFLEEAAKTNLHARWLIGLMLGLRQGEVLGLAWNDVDLDEALLQVRQALQRQPDGKLALVAPKTQRSRRTVPLPPSVVAALRTHRDEQRRWREAAAGSWVDSGLVFTTGAGRPFHPRNDYRSFRALLDRAQIREIRQHDLRHTTASLLLALGVHPRVVMEILGHSAIGVTMNTYSHVVPALARDAANSIESALWGPS